MIIPNPGYQEYTDEVQETLKEESESIFLQPKQGESPKNYKKKYYYFSLYLIFTYFIHYAHVIYYPKNSRSQQ